MNEQERLLRDWLTGRDPGAAPARLRTAVAQVPQLQRTPIMNTLDELKARFRWVSPATRLVVLAGVLLALALTIIAGALLHPTPPFPPPGLIAYAGYGIHVTAADGSSDRALTQGGHEKAPRWSPDGRSILFIRFVPLPEGEMTPECGEQTSIVVHDLDLGTERVLATEPIVISAEWSPRGDKIAFFGYGGGVGQMGSCELAGSGVIDVASGRVSTSDAGIGAYAMSWSGDSLAFSYPDHLGLVAASALNAHAAIESILTFEAAHGATLSPATPYATLWAVPDEQLDVSKPVEIVDLSDGSRIDLGPGIGGWWSPDGSAVAFVRPGRPDDVPGRVREEIAVTVGAERRLRKIGEFIVPGDSVMQPRRLGPMYWTTDGRAIYWLDDTGGHVVDVATGRTADLPLNFHVSDDLQWQPVPTPQG